MKKFKSILTFGLLAASALLFASCERNKINIEKASHQTLATGEKKSAMEQWEETPAGKQFRHWEASPEGKKVHTSVVKISKSVREFTNMEGVVTSLSLPAGSRLGFGVMVNIKGEDYILAFGVESNHDFAQLHSLKVNDKIIIRSRSLTKAPKYAYPILTGHYIERNGNVLYKFIPRNGGC